MSLTIFSLVGVPTCAVAAGVVVVFFTGFPLGVTVILAVIKEFPFYLIVAVYKYANWYIYPFHSFDAQIQPLHEWP